MATVTGLTAEAMAAIRNGAIVDATVDGAGHLILTHFDGSEQDVGSVQGPEGEVGPAGLSLANLPITQVRDVGDPTQIRAGRNLRPPDFSTLLGLDAPLGMWLTDDGAGAPSQLVDQSGNARNLSNKGAVPFGTGLFDEAGASAVFSGNSGQGLYIPDSGAADPFRIRTGSFGCWFRTSKRITYQSLISKTNNGETQRSYMMMVHTNNSVGVWLTTLSSTWELSLVGTIDVCDDRWHFATVTFDGHAGRLYIDGVLDSAGVVANTTPGGNGALAQLANPFAIGGNGLDASTAAQYPNYGRVGNVFVTREILSEEQVRLLYCAKIPHGYASTPKMVILNVHRRRRGALLAASDFPSAPSRLYNMVDLNDLGSNNVPLTANPATGSIVAAPGPEGVKDTARSYNGAHNGDSGTDAGLPTTGARTLGAWVKTTDVWNDKSIMAYGTPSGEGMFNLRINSAGTLVIDTWTTNRVSIASPITDGQWHHVVALYDPAAIDGLLFRLYVDGKMWASAPGTPITTVLAGANRFRVGASAAGAAPFYGQIARAFVFPGALSAKDIAALYAKGALDLGASPKNPGDHIEAFDATNVYATFDTLEPQNTIDMAVAA